MTETTALIIGAGPAGLATAAALQKAGISSITLEKDTGAGGAYAKLHPELKLVSPRRYLNLPHLNLKAKNEIVAVGEFRSYLDEYSRSVAADRRYCKEVIAVSSSDQGVTVKCSDESEYAAKVLVVCTGMMSFPRPFPLNAGGTRVEQAWQWRGAEAYRGKKILVVGGGTSASEIATLAALVTEVWLSVRSPLKTVPLTPLGINIHYGFEWIERLPKSLFPKVCSGDFKEPALDFGLRKAIAEERVRVKEGALELKNGVAVFADGSEVEPDIIISCLGYEFRTQYLPADIARNKKGWLLTHQNRSTSHRRIFAVGHPCSGAIDSKFIRGIARDAARVASQIGREV
ncbi:MAG: NAD(P)/FAD-dependent oxidoreductase [Bdellovibrionia bacterium]